MAGLHEEKRYLLFKKFRYGDKMEELRCIKYGAELIQSSSFLVQGEFCLGKRTTASQVGLAGNLNTLDPEWCTEIDLTQYDSGEDIV
ncbi:hypothetical protein BPOR_0993g00050 [Botrytis porri]|uniref:Uncharacterized protein n=1 Tax=Botrytis porri TaxID=87229 RepID=A0A4Z1KK93_9HELO|nr:hypothetical protein BPOR_0993g00050 [Botrytis porri]